MIFRRFYDVPLAQASYLVACGETHEAVVIDPSRDIEPYLRTAEEQHLRITAVTETHIHADFVSGSRELAARTGARAYLSDEGDADWKYGWTGDPNVALVRGGDAIRAGRLRLDVLATPGHTPEHVCFVLTDEAASDKPLGVFTGDLVFVADVGRPDLLERAADVAGTMERSARTLFRTLVRFKTLPEYLMLWPAHGAGSACGKNLGDLPATTLAYEKLVNWGLRATDEDAFVGEVLSGQPEPPVYFKEMKRINKVGPRVLGGLRAPARLADAKLVELLDRGAVVVDTRPSARVAEGHAPGVLGIPRGSSFTTWAGWLLPYDRPIHLIADSETAARGAVRDLATIALDDVCGWMGPESLEAYRAARGALATTPAMDAQLAAERAKRGEAQILDVRGMSEYVEGHVPGATHIPLGYLAARAATLAPDRPIVVHCHAGTRARIAATLLHALGRKDVFELKDGLDAYHEAGLPMEKGESTVTART